MRADTKDVVGGGILAAIGLYVLATSSHYTIGTARQMGPGYYPMIVGGLLILLGLMIAALALFRAGGRIERPDWRPLAAVLGSVVIFALTVRNLGLVPAVIACTFVCAAGRRGWNPRSTLLLAVLLAVATWLLFSRFLGLTMPALTWPVLIL